jgi:hypothetical protein
MRDKLTELTERTIAPDSPIGLELAEWKASMVEHLGGQDRVSVAQRELIELAAAERLILHSLDAYIAELGSGVINRRHRQLYPIVEARGRQADRFQRRLEALTNPSLKPRASHHGTTAAAWAEALACDDGVVIERPKIPNKP